MTTEALADPDASAREITELLGDPTDNPDGAAVQAAACHAELHQLRDRLLEVVGRLRDSSDAYYYLCRVVEGQLAPPVLHVDLFPENPAYGRMRVPLPLGDLRFDASGRDLLTTVLARAAEDYVNAWAGLKGVVDAGADVCGRLHQIYDERTPPAPPTAEPGFDGDPSPSLP